jgi:hypothetical protein
MKQLSIFCLFALFYFNATAQLKEIFLDDFSSNKNRWSSGKTDGLYAEVKDGKYIIDCGVNKFLNPQVIIGIDSAEDYSISVNFSVSKSLSPNSGAGILFGSNMSDYFAFFIGAEGKFNIVVVKNNAIISENNGANKEAIKSGEGVINNLRVEKNDLLWEFYVNDKKVKILAAEKLNGLFTGLAALPGARYEFDDLKVSGTAIVTTGSFCQLFPLIYESARNKFSYIMGMKTEKNQFACLNYQSPENIMTIVPGCSASTLSYSIKKYATHEEGIKGLKEFIAEQEKCLPGFQFTEATTTTGQPTYKIAEKVSKDGSIISSSISLTRGDGPVDIFLVIVSINKNQ